MDAPRLARPCPLRARDLALDGGRCASCGCPVVDLSSGTEAQAHALLARGAPGCLAWLQDAAGRLVFGRRALTAGLTVAAALGASAAPRLEGVGDRLPAPPAEVACAPERRQEVGGPEGAATPTLDPGPPAGAPEPDRGPTPEEIWNQLLLVGYVDGDS